MRDEDHVCEKEKTSREGGDRKMWCEVIENGKKRLVIEEMDGAYIGEKEKEINDIKY